MVADPPESVAPAGATLACTTTLGWLTGLPLASWIWIVGCGASSTPLWAVLGGCVTITNLLGSPAASAIGPEVAAGWPDRLGALKRSV